VAAVSEHVIVKIESPQSELGLTTRFERNPIAMKRKLAGGDPTQDAIGECQLKRER
jgi:hypothetical protein